MVRLHKTEGCSRYGASADRRGSHFDLVIIALLFQTDQISPKNLEEYAFIGELSLDGRIRPCSGVLVYAYESESYRDPVTKQPRCRRKYLGRVDPETKMIIPKAEKGKRNRGSNASVNKVLPDDVIREINEQKQQIQELQAQVSELSRKNKNNTAIIKKMRQLLDTCE